MNCFFESQKGFTVANAFRKKFKRFQKIQTKENMGR